MPKTTKKTGTKRTSIRDLPKPAEELTAEQTKTIKGGLVGDLGLLAAKPKPGTGQQRPLGKRFER